MNERLGIIESQQRLRESATRNLTPSARHQAFPALFAKPVPFTDPAAEARASIIRLTSVNEELRAKISGLEGERTELLKQLEIARSARPMAMTRRVSIAEVQKAFCDAFNASTTALGGQPYSVVDLASARRSQAMARPRMVCMDLVRRLCPVSYPMIGKAFGGRDHTTVMHAIQRAPLILADSPLLEEVHAKVLAQFEAKS